MTWWMQLWMQQKKFLHYWWYWSVICWLVCLEWSASYIIYVGSDSSGRTVGVLSMDITSRLIGRWGHQHHYRHLAGGTASIDVAGADAVQDCDNCSLLTAPFKMQLSNKGHVILLCVILDGWFHNVHTAGDEELMVDSVATIRNTPMPLKSTILDGSLCPMTKTPFCPLMPEEQSFNVQLMGYSCYSAWDLLTTYHRAS